MKKIIATTLALSFSIFMLAACSSTASSSSSSSISSSDASSTSKADSETTSGVNGVYRGTVVDYEDNLLTVEQVEGYDYGQSTIIFNINDDTVISDNGVDIVPGAFVEITYDGALTRSIPPQGNAESVNVIASFSEGIVQNGVIQDVSTEGDNYYISIMPIDEYVSDESKFLVSQSDVQSDDFINTILIVPKDALENITEKELVAGAKISAVTSGIATASLPPQMPVLALLPYTVAS